MEAAPPVLLDNGIIRVEVDPASGALARVELKTAFRFPLNAPGAGVAGSGRLFLPWLESAGGSREVLSSADRPATSTDFHPNRTLRLTWKIGGLTLMRRITMPGQAAEFTIDDELRNGSDGERSGRVGLLCRQSAEPWRRTDRTWIGNAQQCLKLASSSLRPAQNERRLSGSPLFWRQIEEYGTGLLARIDTGGREGEISARGLPGAGRAVEVGWRAEPFHLASGESVRWTTEVSVDEGGGAPDEGNAFAPVLARADFAAAGRSGESVLGFATAVSARSRQVVIIVATDHELARAQFQLVPGKVARLPVALVPAAGGETRVRVKVLEDGRLVSEAAAGILVDGAADSPIWRTYSRRMPEENYRGSWAEIGEQLVRSRDRLHGSNSVEITVGKAGGPDNNLAYFRRHRPYYADLLAGIARAESASPERIFVTERTEPSSDAACMDVAFYGPDGPINAFSKERGGPSFAGLGYVKVVPSAGYRFHVYMHYGINSEGLSISGASLNEDAATTARGEHQVAERLQSGRPGLAPRIGIWMLLASCRTVPEALAFMQDPAAPILMGPSNMLLLDREGRAACVESCGDEYHVYRQGGPGPGFYVSGNYPHPVDGRFQLGPALGWAENTHLREAFLNDYAGARQGRLGLRDVLTLMQSHEAGGMCQHHEDNPGQLYTSCSFIAVTRTGDLWLSEGPPCETAYVRHTLGP